MSAQKEKEFQTYPKFSSEFPLSPGGFKQRAFVHRREKQSFHLLYHWGPMLLGSVINKLMLNLM